MCIEYEQLYTLVMVLYYSSPYNIRNTYNDVHIILGAVNYSNVNTNHKSYFTSVFIAVDLPLT